MDTNTNSTMETITAHGTACKRNYGKLPQVAYFRVQSRNMVGTIADRHERACGQWALLVSCKDGKGLRLVSDVADEFGMIIKGEFKTREDAIAAGKDYVAKWGHSKVSDKAEKAKTEAADAVIAALAAKLGQTPETLKQLLAA